jgi:tripartite-type tricarboxylate transporter receptor subunit TctC
MRKSVLFSAAVVAAGGLLAQPALADDLANMYRGKTVTIVFGYSVGGTYGKTSLVLSRHLGKFIPGNPDVIMQSMPGAGGLKATNFAYNAMPKDGFHILMPPDMSMVSQLLRPEKVKFDTKNFYWLGRVFGANNMVVVRRDTGVRTIQDATKKKVIMGSTGKGSPTFIVTSLVNSLLGTRFEIVTGYGGSGPTKLAMERGEVNGISLSWASWKNDKLPWFQGRDSFVLPLVQNGFEREEDWPDVPLIRDLAQGEDNKAAADLIATNSLIGRSLALMPGVPNKIIEPLREAFWKTVNSPEFTGEATRTKLPLVQKQGAEIQQTVGKILNMSPTAIAVARKAIFGK